ncbi:ER membrane protein complex subunit 10 [Phalaenopsis equestris]|uniref:ER membrane protein complex subunit 10 n=1 Tax=Phalaenopsis equestris TaxID=78828 RepID=UPI0009E4AE7B|nr:ER membrane protein complex subunit 10 [Phalaenopsis equestris]
MKHAKQVFYFIFLALIFCYTSLAFQSDELILDDEEFILEGSRAPELEHTITKVTPSSRRRGDLDSSLDSKSVQFTLEHAFGDSVYFPAGTFTARLKTWSHGGQTLTKLRFSRTALSDVEKDAFKRILEQDDFITIRVPSNVLNPPGKGYIMSSVRARCIPRESLDELFVIHTDGVDILAVNYGSAGSCQYPRPLKFPRKWSFNSHTVMKNSEQARRTPTFTEELLASEPGVEEALKAPERSFWSKYWMYLIPLGLIVLNAVTQAMNIPEEQQPAGQPASQPQQPIVQRAPNSAARRR